MSSDNARKKKARRHKAATGDSYTRSRRLTNERTTERPPTPEEAAQAAAIQSLLRIEGTPNFTDEWKASAGNPTAGHTNTAELLRVPLGLQPDDETPLVLELNHNDGRGTTGILIGTTGSGKTAALQTIVFALCARYSPEKVELMLLAAKSTSSAFTTFENYPHVNAVVTDGYTDALRDLIVKRTNLWKQPSAPTPQTVVIIDDLPALLDHDAALFDAVDQLVRVSRTLGIHVLVAAQSLREMGGRAGLTRNVRYRIALRAETEQDSYDVIGTGEAALIPGGAPGSGYYRPHPDAAPVRFRSLPTPRSLIRSVAGQFTER